MDERNEIAEKSKAFALRIIRLFDFLQREKHDYVLSKQLLRSGTSIGAMSASPAAPSPARISIPG